MDAKHDYLYGCDILGGDLVGAAFSFDVAAVQAALVQKGYSVGKAGVDGLMGKDTTDAIKKFQAASGMPQTGTIDEKLKQALGLSSVTFTEDEVVTVEKPSTQTSSAPSSTATSTQPSGTSSPSQSLVLTAKQSPSFFSQPMWAGGPKVWQGTVGGLGLIALFGALYYSRR